MSTTETLNFRTWLICPVKLCDKQIHKRALRIHLEIGHTMSKKRMQETLNEVEQ